MELSAPSPVPRAGPAPQADMALEGRGPLQGELTTADEILGKKSESDSTPAYLLITCWEKA